MKRQYYFYRKEMIERFGKGWCWTQEMCHADITKIPVYKTIEDARNAIRKYMDSTQKREPRVIQIAGWNPCTREYYIVKEC